MSCDPARLDAGSQPGDRAISDELLGAFMSLMPDAAVAVDGEGRIASTNEEAIALFGYEGHALVGLPVETLIPERVRHRHRQHRAAYGEQAKRRPMGVGLELTGRRFDGSEFPVDVSLAPIARPEGVLVVAAIRDMTEVRSATLAEAQLASIVRSSRDAIVSTTISGQITSWNPGAEHLLGYGSATILGRHIATLIPESSSRDFEELLELAGEEGTVGARDTQWRRQDGELIDVAVSVSPMKDRSGAVVGYSAMARDIGDRRRAEIELRRLLAEERRLEQQHAVTAEIRLMLLSGAPLSDSLALICEKAAELLEVGAVGIGVKLAGEVRLMAAAGASAPLAGIALPADLSFIDRVIAEGRPQQLERLSEGSRVPMPDDMPDGPALGLPIVVGGATIGALAPVRATGAPRFSPADIVAAESLASQAALAFELERARTDREQMMLATDRERIGRDLHDHVIQQLFATGMTLQSTLPLLGPSQPRERILDAVDSLDDTIREIRNAIYELSRAEGPPLLRSQVLEVVREAETALGFTPSVRFDGPVDAVVPDRALAHVLAVVREALSNAARHAHASDVDVRIGIDEGTLTVTVTDNGVGIENPARSSGLGNLEERARLLDGSFLLSSGPDGGTRLAWRVPLDG